MKSFFLVANGTKIVEVASCIKTLSIDFIIVGSSVLESVKTEILELKPIENIINPLLN